ncbi:MAG: extracellular solute-binding protein [Anaerolineales bacterium]|jgi:spermidine/putrescine-binding protein|nr:extracellular solute-binding protein [Anaerolineales bacterium]MCW5838953.1 extracellular solute-binding protein [Anaerolineales bacterium]
MKLNKIKNVVLLLLAAAVLAACGGSAAAPNTQLIVLEWSGYEEPSYWEPFALQHPEIAPEYSFFGEDAEAFSKAQSGFQFDVVHPCGSWWGLYVEAGLVQPLDVSRLSNFDKLFPTLAEHGQFDGKQYFIPWDWAYESITVRTDLVDEVPDSWADLWDPQYAGQVAIFDSGESTFLTAAYALGYDPYNTTPEQQEAIKQHLIALKPNLLTYWVDYTEINQLLAAGDVAVGANTWNDAWATLADEGYQVEYVNPKEGRISYACGFGISANSTNVDLAYDYINALIDAQSNANMANDFYYGAANMESVPLLDPALVDVFQFDDPAVLASSNFQHPLTQEQRQMMTTIWNEVKAEQ